MKRTTKLAIIAAFALTSASTATANYYIHYESRLKRGTYPTAYVTMPVPNTGGIVFMKDPIHFGDVIAPWCGDHYQTPYYDSVHKMMAGQEIRAWRWRTTEWHPSPYTFTTGNDPRPTPTPYQQAPVPLSDTNAPNLSEARGVIVIHTQQWDDSWKISYQPSFFSNGDIFVHKAYGVTAVRNISQQFYPVPQVGNPGDGESIYQTPTNYQMGPPPASNTSVGGGIALWWHAIVKLLHL